MLFLFQLRVGRLEFKNVQRYEGLLASFSTRNPYVMPAFDWSISTAISQPIRCTVQPIYTYIYACSSLIDRTTCFRCLSAHSREHVTQMAMCGHKAEILHTNYYCGVTQGIPNAECTGPKTFRKTAHVDRVIGKPPLVNVKRLNIDRLDGLRGQSSTLRMDSM